MKLDHDATPPFRVVATERLAEAGDIALRVDRVRWPDGAEADYRLVEGPDSCFVVAVHDDGTTVLVRQWRHAWARTAWEVPAGTLDSGEEPLLGARRELEEEAGLQAAEWTPLGATHGTALLTSTAHHFLARRLTRVPRTPESYERDMVTMELPLREAVEAALEGEIEHAGSVTAILRAARRLSLL